MFSSFKQFKRTSVACVAIGSIFVSGHALAAGTAPGQNVDNIASVNYSVGGVPQTVIRSAPGAGNSTPGALGGATTRFVVDRKVDLHLVEVSTGPTSPVIPGSLNQVTTFFLRNDGNDTQGVQFTAADFGAAVFGDAPNFPMGNIRYFVESTAPTASCTVATQPALMQFTLGTDSAATIAALAPDTCTWVYIVADTPADSENGEFSNVELTATARAPNTLVALLANTGADQPLVVDVVFADDVNATVFAQDQYEIATAAFTVTKGSAVIDDYVSTSNFKAIPNALMEYTITLANNGGAQADTVQIADALPTQTAFSVNAYNGNADVRIQVGATSTYCVAELGGDSNLDGCHRTLLSGVTTLTVRNPAIPSVPAAGSVIVNFRVTIL